MRITKEEEIALKDLFQHIGLGSATIETLINLVKKIRRGYEEKINKEYVHVAKIDWSKFPPILLNERDK